MSYFIKKENDKIKVKTKIINIFVLTIIILI